METPDGLNINLNVGSTHPEALQRDLWALLLVLAFDGDSDRLIAVDENGESWIDGDKIMYIIGKYLSEKAS